MKKDIYKYMMVLLVALTVCSCTNENEIEGFTEDIFLKFEIGGYPTYDVDSRVVGIPDKGNDCWVKGDAILVKVTEGIQSETLVLTYENSKWTPSKSISATDAAVVEVLYAPGCEWDMDGNVKLKSDARPYGTFDYVMGDCYLKEGVVRANFTNKRNYSRLRIAPDVYQEGIQAFAVGFTPAGPTSAIVPTEGYTLTTDYRGNAYLYGIFSTNSTIQINKDGNLLREYIFATETLPGKSYVMEAVCPTSISVPYVTFFSDSEQMLFMTNAIETLEYSVGSGEWKELGTNIIAFGGEKGKLCLRGKSSSGTVVNNITTKIKFVNDTYVTCIGDIRTLIDYENYSSVSTGNARFSQLFSGCYQLVSVPDLPATTLADSCYTQMFEGCINIIEAPDLPATSLTERCYFGMFSGCTGLTEIPELPATILADYCYNGMFSDCISLMNAPELPATTLTESCYGHMFSGCINLETAPSEISSNSFPRWCCYGMFSGCTNLEMAPSISATTLGYWSCTYMFLGCTKLKKAPNISATTLEEWSCVGMFSGCISLESAPFVLATNLGLKSCGSMFSGCTSLVKAPELPATELAKECYSDMFSDCISLAEAPELPATELTETCYGGMFSGCTSLKEAPVLPATTLVRQCYSAMFSGCTNLNKVTMLATNVRAEECLAIWLWDVSSTGVFIKNKDMKSLPSGDSGIPYGWSVVDYEE